MLESLNEPGRALRSAAVIAACLLTLACGPTVQRGECEYAELEGTCALVEVGDYDPNGSPGKIRARYRLVQSGAPELGNHIVLVGECSPERHMTALRYFREHKSVECTLGVRTRGNACPETRVLLDLPPPDVEGLAVDYQISVVGEHRAQPTVERPFGDGKSVPWP